MADQVIIYRETQRFKQVWLWVVILGAASLFWLGFIHQVVMGETFGRRPVTDAQLIILVLVMGLGMPLFFYMMQLTTEVTQEDIKIRLWPFHIKPVGIPLHLVKDYEQVTYKPIAEYGGWGIRWGLKGKAYNMSGNQGVKLIFYHRQPLLIGSQDAKSLYEAIKLAKELKK